MARKQLTIIDLYSSELPFATEFRRLLRRLKSVQGEQERKTLLMTSAMLAEGKSTVTAFLGVTAGRQESKKTLIIDADLRRPTIHKFFGMTRDKGLVEVLTHELEPKDAVKNTGLEELDVITAGQVVNRPSDVFNAESIGQVIDEMKFYYDLILVDCAPVLPVSDPMLLAPKLDGILMIVKAGATQIDIVKRAITILDTHHSHILGVVLNNMNNSMPYYYDYQYYGYRHTEDRKKRSARSSQKKRQSQSRKVRPTDRKDNKSDSAIKISD